MNKLRELDWFNESWATEVRNTMRYLVCSYADAYEAVDRLQKPIQLVRLSGLSIGRRLLVIKPLLRDAIASHVDIVLSNITTLLLRGYRAARPTLNDLPPGVSRNAEPERRAEAEAKRAAFIQQQERIAGLLEEAVRDAKELRERIGTKGEGGTKTFKIIIRGVRRILPIAWAAWAAALISSASQTGGLQFGLYIVGVIIVYHALALLGLPFHDAAERKHALFEGIIEKPASDGLTPMFPEVSRFENGLFKLLGTQPPVVILWDHIVPLFHYVTAAVLVAYAAFALPLEGKAKNAAWMVAAMLIFVYGRRLMEWWTLVHLRCRGRSVWQILLALFAVIQTLEIFQPPDDKTDHSETDKE